MLVVAKDDRVAVQEIEGNEGQTDKCMNAQIGYPAKND